VGVFPLLTLAFVVFASLHRRGGSPVVFTGLSLHLATVFALAVFAMLRLNAWRRAHPWTPPS